MFNVHRCRRRLRPRSRLRSRFSRLRLIGLITLLSLTGGLGGLLPTTTVQPASAQQQPIQPAALKAPAAMAESPLDQPLRILAEAQQAYNAVQSYECILISQESINGKLQPENVIQMTFRKNPFSVYLKWLHPKDQVGQEACFVQGRYQNSMRVLPAGWGKMTGWMTLDVNDPKVTAHSRHKITEAGFGNWLERCAKAWNAERTAGKTQVQVAEYDYNKRRCIRVETAHTVRDRTFYCYRNVVYFDVQTHLPVRMECYDWPRPGGPPEGELLECFSYINLQFNVAIPESVFMH